MLNNRDKRNLLEENSLFNLLKPRNESIRTSSINLNNLLPNETGSDFGFQNGKIYEIYGTINSSRISLLTDIACNCLNRFDKDVLFLNSSYQIPQEMFLNSLNDKSKINKINTIKLIGNGIGMIYQIFKQELLMKKDNRKDYKLIIINDLPSLVYHETMNIDRRSMKNRKVLRTLNKNISERRRYGSKFRLTKYERSLKYGTKRFFNHTVKGLNINQALQANKDQNLFHLFQIFKKYLAINQDCCIILTGILGTKIVELVKTKIVPIIESPKTGEDDYNGEALNVNTETNETEKRMDADSLNNAEHIFALKPKKTTGVTSTDYLVKEKQNIESELTSYGDEDDVFGSTFDEYELPPKPSCKQATESVKSAGEESHTVMYNNILIDTNKFIPTAMINKESGEDQNEEGVGFLENGGYNEIDIELGNNYYDDLEIEMNNPDSLEYRNYHCEFDGTISENEIDENNITNAADNIAEFSNERAIEDSDEVSVLYNHSYNIISNRDSTGPKKSVRINPNVQFDGIAAGKINEDDITHQTHNYEASQEYIELSASNNTGKNHDNEKSVKKGKNKRKTKNSKKGKVKMTKSRYNKARFRLVKSKETKPIKRKQLVPLHGQNPLWYEFVDSRIILYKDWLIKPTKPSILETLFCRDVKDAIRKTKQNKPLKLIDADYAMVEKRSFKSYSLGNGDMNLFMTEEQIKLNIVRKLCYFRSQNGRIFDISYSKFKPTGTKFWKDLEKKVGAPEIKESNLTDYNLDDFKKLLLTIDKKSLIIKTNAEVRDTNAHITNDGDNSDTNTIEDNDFAINMDDIKEIEKPDGKIAEYDKRLPNFQTRHLSNNPKASRVGSKNDRNTNMKHMNKDEGKVELTCVPIAYSCPKDKKNGSMILTRKRSKSLSPDIPIDDVEYNFIRSLKKPKDSESYSCAYLDDLPSKTSDLSNMKISKFGRRLIEIYNDNRLPQFEDYENFDEYESEHDEVDAMLERDISDSVVHDSQFDDDDEKLILPDAKYYKTIDRIRMNLQQQVSSVKLIRVLNKIGKQSDYENLTRK